jgi:hypothetical protein
MKRAILLTLISIQLITAREADVRKSIGIFFEGLHTADTLKIKSVCIDGLVLQSVSYKGGESILTTENAAAFYRSIASIPATVQVEERLLSYTIHTDGAMAHAWTPYEFYINGKLSHSGVNSFQLYNDKGVWKVAYIMDTRRSIRAR